MNKCLVDVFLTITHEQVIIRKFKKTATASAAETSLNKRLNEQDRVVQSPIKLTQG